MNPLKRGVKGWLDAAVIPVIRYIKRKTAPTTVLSELEKRTSAECADYAQARMQTAIEFERKEPLWDHALARSDPKGLLAEFGVWRGDSINHLAKKATPRVVYGFDSFEGLEEDWAGSDLLKGKFDEGGRMPRVEPNVRLVKGRFDATLPGFLEETAGSFSFIHIDCDTYEGASAALKPLSGRIQRGTVLVFDEYFGYRGWRIGEFKAWQECAQTLGIEYEYMAFSTQTVALRVTSLAGGRRRHR